MKNNSILFLILATQLFYFNLSAHSKIIFKFGPQGTEWNLVYAGDDKEKRIIKNAIIMTKNKSVPTQIRTPKSIKLATKMHQKTELLSRIRQAAGAQEEDTVQVIITTTYKHKNTDNVARRRSGKLKVIVTPKKNPNLPASFTNERTVYIPRYSFK